MLGTCTTDPTAPISQQCASGTGVAQTMGQQAGNAISDFASGVTSVLGSAASGLSASSGGTALMIVAAVVGLVFLSDMLAPSKRRRR